MAPWSARPRREAQDGEVSEIPRGAFGRGLRLASLPVSLVGRQAIGLGKRVGGASSEDVAAQMQAATAEQLFSVLGRLKGGAMKFGQALSVLEAALPEEMAGPYRQTLTKLQDAAPPMAAASVHRVLADQLGGTWRTLFQSFEDTPTAAASVGQVHRAVWQDGREVAVKIQYPGAGAALVSDLNQVARVVRLTAGWVPGLDIGPVLAELKERVAEEVDYRYEAQAQQGFHDAFADDPDIAVPAVVHVADRVIVTEWMAGVPLSHLIANGTQEERDLAARRYLEFLLTGPQRAGLLHADPHPGNFRLTPGGRFGVLDFGAVHRLPEGTPPAIGNLLALALEGDAEGVVEGLRDEGFIKASIDVDPQALLAYLDPFIAVLRPDEFTFDRAWLQAMFTYVNDVQRPDWWVSLKLNLPREYVMIWRVWLGGIGVLSQLGGTVPAYDILADHLPGFAAWDEEEPVDDSSPAQV
jgi:predicted unusual protein kinase regulating ubiquinone biosynthesis (AarF/ABC1/UbiB family)